MRVNERLVYWLVILAVSLFAGAREFTWQQRESEWVARQRAWQEIQDRQDRRMDEQGERLAELATAAERLEADILEIQRDRLAEERR